MKKQLSNAIVTTAVLFALPFSVHAHSAAGSLSGFTEGFIHPWSGIDHVLVMTAIGLWSVIQARQNSQVRFNSWCLPTVFLIAMLAGFLSHLLDVTISHVELFVAFSVLAVGVVLLLDQTVPARLLTILVILFASSHGYVHADDVGVDSDLIGYTSGFLLATSLLLLTGAGLGRFKPYFKVRLRKGYGVLCVITGLTLLAGF